MAEVKSYRRQPVSDISLFCITFSCLLSAQWSRICINMGSWSDDPGCSPHDINTVHASATTSFIQRSEGGGAGVMVSFFISKAILENYSSYIFTWNTFFANFPRNMQTQDHETITEPGTHKSVFFSKCYSYCFLVFGLYYFCKKIAQIQLFYQIIGWKFVAITSTFCFLSRVN